MNAAAPVQIAVHAVPVAKARPRVSATGVVWPTGRPDTDNITKAALDALNGMVVRDDAQVVEIAATKRYRAATPVSSSRSNPSRAVMSKSPNAGTSSTRRANGREPEPELPDWPPAPHNLAAEAAVLGAVLLDNNLLDDIAGIIEPQHFYDPLHRQIYEGICTLVASGKRATPITMKGLFENHEPIDAALTVVGTWGNSPHGFPQQSTRATMPRRSWGMRNAEPSLSLARTSSEPPVKGKPISRQMSKQPTLRRACWPCSRTAASAQPKTSHSRPTQPSTHLRPTCGRTTWPSVPSRGSTDRWARRKRSLRSICASASPVAPSCWAVR